MSEYFLGTSDHELARLGFQQEVWERPTESFLDSLDLRPGERVMDLGCGPGFVTERVLARVGEGGAVLAVDESQRWVDHVEGRARQEGWTGLRVERTRLQDLRVEAGAYDAAVLRWVLSFLPEPGSVLAHLARGLRPGGRLGVMDYNHLGVSLFPRSEGFDAVIRATREAYRLGGGDPFVMGSIHRHFRTAGLEPAHLENFVLAGGPGSPAFAWADRFFPFHVPRLVESGVLDPADAARFDAEWAERKRDPDVLFYSPIVVAAVGMRAD